jgi:hypothetical protein
MVSDATVRGGGEGRPAAARCASINGIALNAAQFLAERRVW